VHTEFWWEKTHGKRKHERRRPRRKSIKRYLKGIGLKDVNCIQGQIANSCEHVNGLSGSTESVKFPQQPRHCLLETSVCPEASARTSEQASKKASEQERERANKQASKRASEQERERANKQARKKASKRESKRARKRACEQASKRASEQVRK